MTWQFKKLEDISIRVKDGLHKTPEYVADGVPFISTTNLKPFSKDFNFNSYEKYISLKSYKELFKNNKPQKGDVLISKCGTIGVSQLIRTNMDFGIFVGLALVTLNKNVLGEYFEYYLHSPYAKTEMNDLCTGTTRKTLALQAFKKLKVPVPTLSEQKEIIKILDTVFEKIEKAKENAETNLKNSKEIFESYLNDVFEKIRKNNSIVKFGSVCNFVRGPFGGSLKKSYFVPVGFAVYEQQHAIKNQFSKIRYFITENKFEEMKRFELKSGDLIMSCSGTMGKIAIVPNNIKKGIINQALLKLTPKNILNINYLKHWMESNDFQNELIKLSKGAAIKNVASVKILKEIKLPLPELKKQEEIITIINNLYIKTKKLEEIYNKKLKSLEELKNSILEKAFKGELTKDIYE